MLSGIGLTFPGVPPILDSTAPRPMTPCSSARALVAAALVGLAAIGVAAPAAAVPLGDTPVVSLVHTDDTPQPFRLSLPSPNPFAAHTELQLTVDRATTLSVAVYDALGRRVALVHDGDLRPGTYRLRVEAGSLPAGLYLIRATDGRGQTATRSVSLVR